MFVIYSIRFDLIRFAPLIVSGLRILVWDLCGCKTVRG